MEMQCKEAAKSAVYKQWTPSQTDRLGLQLQKLLADATQGLSGLSLQLRSHWRQFLERARLDGG
jgi:hypothetical protein